MVNFKKVATQLYKKYSRFLPVLFLLLVLLLFGKTLVVLTAILIMILTGSLIGTYKLVFPVDLGIELLTFYTIVLCFAVSPMVAWIVGTIIIVLSHFFTRHICFFIVIKILVYGFLCGIALVMAPLGIQSVGKVIIIARNIILFGITIITNQARATSYILGHVLNVLINLYLLSVLAEPLIHLMG